MSTTKIIKPIKMKRLLLSVSIIGFALSDSLGQKTRDEFSIV